MNKFVVATLASLTALAPVSANDQAAQKWIDQEFSQSTLSPEEQLDEMRWFARAAEPFKGMTINVVSETLTTHEYEARVLAEAFFEITGIRVNHDLIGEGMWLKSCKPRCSQVATFMMPISMTAT